MKKKLGLDYHGVIDTHSDIFKRMAEAWIDRGHEVHLITGTSLTEEKLKEIRAHGVPFTHSFSIIDYHESIGTKIIYDEDGNPWIDDDLWNKSKAEYCRRERITIHFDDSEVYCDYFDLRLGDPTYIVVNDALIAAVKSGLRQHDEMEALGLNVPL